MKKFIKLLLVLIFSFSIVYAEVTDEKNNICFPGVERSAENNYCVNKHWSVNDSNLSNVMSVPYVNSQDRIYDYANLLSESEKTELKQNIDDYTKKTGFDVAIIIVNEYMSDSANDVYAVDFYDYNDFGLKDNSKDYSGVIFIVNMNAKKIITVNIFFLILSCPFPYINSHIRWHIVVCFSTTSSSCIQITYTCT